VVAAGGWANLRAIETLCKASLENMAKVEREYFAELAPAKSFR
jgi:hypothetical protein